MVTSSRFPVSQKMVPQSPSSSQPCRCGMTLAECRNEDATCRHSLTDVAAIVAKEAGDDIKKGLIKD